MNDSTCGENSYSESPKATHSMLLRVEPAFTHGGRFSGKRNGLKARRPGFEAFLFDLAFLQA